jgi:hypothetical protein
MNRILRWGLDLAFGAACLALCYWALYGGSEEAELRTQVAFLAIMAFAFPALFIRARRIRQQQDIADEWDGTLTTGGETLSFTVLAKADNYDLVKINTDSHRLAITGEHAWMARRYRGAARGRQMLVRMPYGTEAEDELYCDKFEIFLPNGGKRDVYFDVSALLNPKTAEQSEAR